MSLIEEALRRVKDPAIPAQPAPPEPASKTKSDGTRAHAWFATPPLTTRHSPSRPQTTTVLLAVTLAVLTLTALFIAGAAFWMGRALSHPQGAAPTAAVASQPTMATAKPKPAPSTEQAPSTATKAPDATPATSDQAKEELVLTGIVEGSGEPYAVINGSIVGVGEQVKGSTLLEIGKGMVKMRRPDGTETALSLPK